MHTISLTDREAQIILAGLAELPLKIALPVVRKIEPQLVPNPEEKKEE